MGKTCAGFDGTGMIFSPGPGALEVREDTELVLSGFLSEPAVIPSGRALICDGNEIADEIRFSGEKVTLGAGSPEREVFNVGDQLVRAECDENGGHRLVLKPHPGALKSGRTYTVVIEDGAVLGSIKGGQFRGLTADSGWSFTVRKSLPAIPEGEITVDKRPGAKAHFSSVQGALDYVQREENDGKAFRIRIMPGIYHELLYYGGSGDITLSGLSGEGRKTPDYGTGEGCVKVMYSNSGVLNPSEEKRNLLSVTGGSFAVENMGFENTYSRRDNPKGSQSEALGMSGSSRTFAAYNCFFKGHQDTVRTQGKAWLYHCFISGDTDFLWTESDNRALLVEKCRLVAVYDEFKAEGSHMAYFTAPRMKLGDRAGKGLVVMDSEAVIEKGMTAWLGRTPWKNGYYNQAAFINVSFKAEEGAVFICDWKNEATPETRGPGRPEALGWKQYGCFDSPGREPSFSALLEERVVEKEYSSRDRILNSVYSLSSGEWDEDPEGSWDIGALILKMGWNCG